MPRTGPKPLAPLAEGVRAAGQGPDRNLVHLSDNELDLLHRTWGPPERNPQTGLPAYGFFDSIAGVLGDVIGGISDFGQAVAPLAQTALSFLNPGAPMTGGMTEQGYGPGMGYNDTVSGGRSGSSGRSPGTIPSWLQLGGGVLNILGNLAASKEREKQQKRLQAQEAQRYAEFMGPHVDYNFDQPTTETIGLAPVGPTELAGFRPEQQWTETRPTPYALGGLTGPQNYQPGGRVGGPGGGQDDAIPAYLSADEYVVPADVVSHLGDGSSTAGAEWLDRLVKKTRSRRTGNTRFPPRVGALEVGG